MSNLPTLNTALLAENLAWVAHNAIDFDPVGFEGWPHWNQGLWFQAERAGASICGSYACFAGNVVVQDDDWAISAMYDKFTATALDTPRPSGNTKWAYPVKPVVVGGKTVRVRDGERSPTPIDRIATLRLGLTSEEAEAMFCGTNDLADLLWLARDFAQARGVTLTLDPELEHYLIEHESGVKWRVEAFANGRRVYTDETPRCG